VKPAALVSTVFLALVAFAHVVRLALCVDVTVGQLAIPTWASLIAFVFTGGLAYALWRESGR
jgi:hypothetical protein